MSLKNIILSVAIAVSTLGLIDCEKKVVTIKYSQPVRCLYFDADPSLNPLKNTKHADPGKMFMYFEINEVLNNEANAKDFAFKLSNVYAGDWNANDPSQNQVAQPTIFPMLHKGTESEVIGAGKTTAPEWHFVIQVAGDLDELKTATQYLKYHVSGEESVLMVKKVEAPKFLDKGCYPGGLKDN